MCQRKGGFGGVKRGQGNHTVPLPPFALRRGHGVPPPVNTGSPGRRRRPLCTLTLSVNLACGGKPPERRNRSPSTEGKNHGAPPTRRKGLPSAADQAFKDLQSLLQRLFLKSLAFHPAVRYNKTTRRGKAFTSRISLTALSLRKGAKAIRTAGSNAEHGNFVALLNFYKLAD